MRIKYKVYRAVKNTYFFFNHYYDSILAKYYKNKGVDFHKNILPEDLGGGDYDYDKFVHYVPSKSWQIKKLIKNLKINDTDSIFDYGFGKGKALYEFSKYKFKKVGGIELTKELVDITETNMQKLNLHEVEIFNANALTFKKLDNYNHFFFFDPFNSEVFKTVINNIVDNYKKSPREITIIYMNVRNHDTVLKEIKGFSLDKSFRNPTRTVIYKYNPNLE